MTSHLIHYVPPPQFFFLNCGMLIIWFPWLTNPCLQQSVSVTAALVISLNISLILSLLCSQPSNAFPCLTKSLRVVFKGPSLHACAHEHSPPTPTSSQGLLSECISSCLPLLAPRWLPSRFSSSCFAPSAPQSSLTSLSLGISPNTVSSVRQTLLPHALPIPCMFSDKL